MSCARNYTTTMSFNVSKFGCLLVTFLFSYHGYEAAIIIKSPTISNIISKDTNICNLTSSIQESQYVQTCGKEYFPDRPINVTKENLNQFLCLILYDRYVKICEHTANPKESKTDTVTVLNNQTLFDGAVKTIIDRGDRDMWTLCETLLNSPASTYNKIIRFTAQSELIFKKKKNCINMCDDNEPTINLMCIVLGVIDQELQKKIMKLKNETINQYSSVLSRTSNIYESIAIKDDKINSKNQDSSSELNRETKKLSNINNPVDEQTSVHQKTQSRLISDKKQTSTPHTHLDATSDVSNKAKVVPPIFDSVSGPVDTMKKNSRYQTTLSIQTRIEDPGDQLADPNLQLADNDHLESEDNDIPIDIQKSPKEAFLDENSIDQKNKIPRRSSMQKEDDSHFFGYFTIIGLIGITSCLVYHHKQKILAMIVEGRRSRGGRGRKRPSTASYRKLDCNLEEAVTSQCNSNVSHVIY